MKKLFICMLLLLNVSAYAQLGYWCKSEFISLVPDSSVSYRYIQVSKAEGQKKMNDLAKRSFAQGNTSVQKMDYDRFLVDFGINLDDIDYYESDIYLSYKGNPVIVLPRIVVSLQDGFDISQILEVLGEKAIVQSSNKDRHILSCDVTSSSELLQLIQKIAPFDGINYFEPEMFLDFHLDNTYYSEQYYLNNNSANCVDINVVPTWNITTGSPNIVVAVIDSGVDIIHEDLGGRVLNGYTCNSPNEIGIPINAYIPPYTTKAHGTACAGIIAASNNQIGIRGIASGSKILPVNIMPFSPAPDNLSGAATNIEIANAIRWAYPRADVLSCSWHIDDDDNCDIAAAIHEAVTLGRGGKGCVVVFSAGNGGNNQNVSYPACLDDVIAVGAIHQNGTIWDYSQTGNKLDLVAPSGQADYNGDVVTLDISGSLGQNATDYMHDFGGTSAACPQVAGVAALMLSVNPSLTAAQVKTKLQQTAVDLGTSGFDTTYGYGLVDAYAAVYSSITTSEIVGPQLISSYATYSLDNIPNGCTVSWSLSDNYYNTHNCLMSNYPSTGHCLIVRDQNQDMMNDTLTAKIKYNGVTVRTLTKSKLYAYAGFKGSYTSGNLSGNINYTYTFNVKANATTYITSPNFLGATVTYSSSGMTPSFWVFNPTYGELTFVAPANNNIPVIINVHDSSGNNYTLYAYTSGSYSINVSNGDGGITVTLVEDGDTSKEFTPDEPWMIEIINATTGQVMATQSSTSRSETISTAGWPKGIYIVKVTIGKEELTEKVVVK